jgi:hypothetical protein
MADEVPWEIKYAPTNFDDFILPPDTPDIPIRAVLKKLYSTGQCLYGGLLITGAGGSGKSTFIESLMKQDWWVVYKVTDTGAGKAEIDQIKLEIDLWDSDRRTGGIKRVLILANEISKSTKDFRDGLRGLLNPEYYGRVFLVATDNHYDKLVIENPELFDDERVLCLDWDKVPKAAIATRVSEILAAEGLLTEENWEKASAYCEAFKPSIRKVLKRLQIYFEVE